MNADKITAIIEPPRSPRKIKMKKSMNAKRSAASMREKTAKQGRIIRRYKRDIAAADFNEWQDQLRNRVRGCGLYALYDKKRLIYVGLATKSIRSRIRSHLKRIPFTHFSVFLVTGSSSDVQARRIRDLEALLLNILQPRPEWNKSKTRFVAAKRLQLEKKRK